MAMSVDEYYQTVLGRPADAEAYQAWGTTIDSSELGLLNQAAAYEQSLSGYQAPIPYSNPGITMEPVALASGSTPSVVDYTPSGAPIFSWEQQAPQTPYYAPEATPVPINFDPWASGGTQHPNIVIGGGPTGGLLTSTTTTPTTQPTATTPTGTQTTTKPTATQGPRFDASGRFLGGATPFKWGDFPIETGTVVNDYGIESLLRANILPGQEQFTNFQTIDQLRQAKPGLFRITVPGGAPGQVAYMEFEKTPDGKYIARETGGHTSLQDMLDNRVNEDDNSLLGMGALGDLAGLALLAAGLYGAGVFGAGGASATTAAEMLAAETEALLAAGFTEAEVAGSLAGLGSATEISGILIAAGIPAATATTLGNQVIANVAAGGTGMLPITPTPTVPPPNTVPPPTVPPPGTIPVDLSKIPADILKNIPSWVLQGGMQAIASYLQNQTNQEANKTNEALTREAMDQAKFRPYGMTTRFGEWKPQFDAKGNFIGGSYQGDPALVAQQNKLLGMGDRALDQFGKSFDESSMLGLGGKRAMELGYGYLKQSPEEQAKDWLSKQQALLSPYRERELAGLENRLLQQGRLGLATGGTSSPDGGVTPGLMAANPELEAFYNAKRMQDLQLASQATEQGRAQAQFGAGMLGTGGDLYKAMYGMQTSAYAPYQQVLQGAAGIESMFQQPMDLSTAMAAKTSTAGANVGRLAGGMQQAPQTNPWAALLGGAASRIGGTPQQQQMPSGQAYDFGMRNIGFQSVPTPTEASGGDYVFGGPGSLFGGGSVQGNPDYLYDL